MWHHQTAVLFFSSVHTTSRFNVPYAQQKVQESFISHLRLSDETSESFSVWPTPSIITPCCSQSFCYSVKCIFSALPAQSPICFLTLLCNSSLTHSPLPNSNLPLLLPSQPAAACCAPCLQLICVWSGNFICLCLQLQQAWIIQQYCKQLFHPYFLSVLTSENRHF